MSAEKKKSFSWGRLFGGTLLLGLGAALTGLCLVIVIFSCLYARLPEIDSIKDYQPKVPLRIYTANGDLIGEFGEERREFVQISKMPEFVKLAVLAAEDNGFYNHPGIEITGIIRAAISNFLTGRRGQGGSTITMQVARNSFLSSERTYTRKLSEIAMAFKIEHNLTKDQILEVYLNQIYLGQRSYGFAAAAQVYFGKTLDQLSIGEIATIAGLPVAPSAYNPIVNPKRATMRKNYVLGRMRDLGYISEQTYQEELQRPLLPKKRIAEPITVHAEHVAEMVRQIVYDHFQEDAYTRGLKVYTTIQSEDQTAAYRAVTKQLTDYDNKYGYRGVTQELKGKLEPASIRSALESAPSYPLLTAAVVSQYTPKKLEVITADSSFTLDKNSLKFAESYKKYKGDKKANPLKVGSVVYIRQSPKNEWTLSQPPIVEAGFIASNFQTGAVIALVGGYDFGRNQFNHVTQAVRQPGSSFKPFIYSAALDKGFNSGTILNDAPIFIDPRLTGGELWEPRNYDNRFDGPMTLATALKKSKNLVSIRVMQSIGARYAQEYATKFGFQASRTPPQLTTALGAGSTTPWEMVAAYTVFANGGYRVKPYLIDRIVDKDNKVLMAVNNAKAGNEAIRAISARNAYIMHTLLNGVIREGTGARAYRTLKRPDMGGKTGTTNNSYDAWFAGYAGRYVAVGWLGYDQMRPLGNKETGGGLTLPIWVEFMQTALKDEPLFTRRQPSSVVLINGNYYYADQVDRSVRNVPLNGKIEERNRERDILRDQVF